MIPFYGNFVKMKAMVGNTIKQEWRILITDENGVNKMIFFLKDNFNKESDVLFLFLCFLGENAVIEMYKILEDLKTKFRNLDFLLIEMKNDNYCNLDQGGNSQEILEKVINQKIEEKMQFAICGSKEFKNYIENRLHFLGIKNDQVFSF